MKFLVEHPVVGSYFIFAALLFVSFLVFLVCASIAVCRENGHDRNNDLLMNMFLKYNGPVLIVVFSFIVGLTF